MPPGVQERASGPGMEALDLCRGQRKRRLYATSGAARCPSSVRSEPMYFTRNNKEIDEMRDRVENANAPLRAVVIRRRP